MTDARTVPFDIPAERATLGSLLLEREAIIAVAPWLRPDQFYLEKHAQVYAAMLACYERREPPDLATVASELRRRERLDAIGGMSFLSDLVVETPTAVHVEYYARSVERTATRRRLIEAGGRIAALGYQEGDSLEETLSLADAELQRVAQNRPRTGYAPIGTVLNDLFTRIEAMQDRRGEIAGLPTGFWDLDRITGGLQRSDLVLLAARPSAGKTSLALSLAYNLALERNGIGIFSLEMSRDQLVQRILAMHTGIDMQRIRLGTLRGDELTLALEGMGVLSNLPIFIEDTAGLSIGDLRARARALCAEQDVRLLVIDYLQLMSAGRSENRVQEVSAISRGLKVLARELDIPILALSQLSRAVEQRQSRVPMLSDLRESGSLEQDADVVMFIYRDELYDRETASPGVAEIHVAKHRNGPLGVASLRFEAKTTQFQNLDRYRAPEGF